MLDLPEEYSLVVAEKPDAAARITTALGRNSTKVERCPEYSICLGKTNYVIVPASGHIFSLAPAYPKRDVYPVLDLRWVPLSEVDKKRKDVDRRIRAFKSLSRHASRFIIACDYDTEGDTIGYNIIKYACGFGRVEAFRAKFSTLTDDELARSFSELVWQTRWPMAEAGRTRHFLDFVWGINLSRVLTYGFLDSGGSYVTLSIGRVQGPTLRYVHQREVEIRCHVPVPYWHATAGVDADGHHFHAGYSIQRIGTQAQAIAVKREVEGNKGIVSEASTNLFTIPPPLPFNLGDLQHEAYRVLGLSPSQTLAIAERLYLQAALSYPRTSSQQIPSSIGYARILEALSRQDAFRSAALPLLEGKLSPVQGQESDPAHPAIFPTGEPPSNLDSRERRVYELVVRRFMASFSTVEVKERRQLRVICGRHSFHASTVTTKTPGWSAIYAHASEKRAPTLPFIADGVEVEFINVDIMETFESPPPRLNQNSLLEQMERDNIGTKATRAETISTLIERGYVFGESLELSDLGFAVVNTMSKYSPSILSTEMTRSIEDKLERVEEGVVDSETAAIDGANQLISCLRLIDKGMTDVGTVISRATRNTAKPGADLGTCPRCHEGHLLMIRSRKTGKRFVGCSNYKGGCKRFCAAPSKGDNQGHQVHLQDMRMAHRSCLHNLWQKALAALHQSDLPFQRHLRPRRGTKEV